MSHRSASKDQKSLLGNSKKTFTLQALLLAILASVVFTAPVTATIGLIWQKQQVLPVVFVKPSIAGFVPVNGNQIGNVWSKDDVVPMCLVKPSLAGFVPVEGDSISNVWGFNQVKPFVEVGPTLGGFTTKD
jgi:hypothetical protein